MSGSNGSSGKCSIPEFRRSPFPMPELACLELALLNLLRQLDSTNSDRRVVESFESEHRPNPLFHPTVILFDEIVQVLARSRSSDHSRQAITNYTQSFRAIRSWLLIRSNP